MLEHGSSVEDEMRKVLLAGSCDETNENTFIKLSLPLWKFQDGVESTAACQAVTLLVHHEGLCLLLTSYNSKNMFDINYKYNINRMDDKGVANEVQRGNYFLFIKY